MNPQNSQCIEFSISNYVLLSVPLDSQHHGPNQMQFAEVLCLSCLELLVLSAVEIAFLDSAVAFADDVKQQRMSSQWTWSSSQGSQYPAVDRIASQTRLHAGTLHT